MLGGAIGITNTHSVGRGARRPRRRGHPVAASGQLLLVAARRRRDMGRHAQRHRRVPRPAGACHRGARRRPRRTGRRGQRRGRHGHGLPRVQGRHRDRLPAPAPRQTAAGRSGVLVQANYGRRGLLRIDGVPVGEAITTEEVPSPYERAAQGAPWPTAGGPARPRAGPARERDGSIIVIVATDAPLLPIQCRRVAQRASLGLARAGGLGSTTSGDLILCFSNGNRGLPQPEIDASGRAWRRLGCSSTRRSIRSSRRPWRRPRNPSPMPSWPPRP